MLIGKPKLMSGKIKIAVAEDHSIVVEGIKTILSTSSDIQYVGCANKGSDLLHLLQTKTPDVLILDLNLGGENGFDILEKIKEQFATLKVIILTMYNEPAFVRKAKSLGANAYLLKNYSSDELLQVISSINDGVFQTSREIVLAKENDNTFNSSFSVISQLSPKEKEIIKHVANGLSSKEIAENLFISVHTVDTHRRNLLKKLNLNNTASLVGFAYENNIIDR